jgi:galactonate dehydratase
MKIDRVATFLVDAGQWRNFVFVRIDTSDGIHGWGEAFAEAGRERAIAAEVEEFGRRLIGRDPFELRRIVADLQVDTVGKLRSLEFCSALSGLEIALWDIVGKALGQPVHQLLGGPYRDRVRLYANVIEGPVDTPDGWAELCAKAVARGFRGVKVYPVAGPILRRADEDAVVAIVAAVRAAIGPDVDLMVDVARLLTPATAIHLAERLAEDRPFWFEEPVPGSDVEGLAAIRARSPIPVLTGETAYSRTAFRSLFERRAVDGVNPDVCNTGGILETIDIAAWAEPNLVFVSPHNWNSLSVGLAATLQVAACVRDLRYVEYLTAWAERSGEFARTPLEVVDGELAIPTVPGVGIDLDEAALARHPYRAYTRNWPD